MPAIDFPASPSVNDEYSFEGRTWLWNGTGWEVKSYPAALQLGSASAPSLYFTGDPNTGLYSPGADQVAISTGGSERARIDSSGRLLVGTSTALNVGSGAGVEGLQIAGTTVNSSIALSRWAASTAGTSLTFAKSRGTTVGTNTIVASGDTISQIDFTAADGSAFRNAASIRSLVDAAPAYAATALVNGQTYRIVTVGTTDFTLIGSADNNVGTVFTATGPGTGTGTAILNAGNMPGRLSFWTTPDGSITPVERMRIRNEGNVGIGSTGSATSRMLVNSNGTTNNTVLEIFSAAVSSGQTSTFYGINADITSNNSATDCIGINVRSSGGTSQSTKAIYAQGRGVSSSREYIGVHGDVEANSGASVSLVYGVYATAAVTGTSFVSTTAALFANNLSAYGALSIGARLRTNTGPTTCVPLLVEHDTTELLRVRSSGQLVIGPSAHSGGALSTTSPVNLYTSTGTYTDTATAASGTVTHGTIVAFDNPAIAATNVTVTYTNASTVYIDGAPTNGTNVTITNPFALYINAGQASVPLASAASPSIVFGTDTNTGFWSPAADTVAVSTAGSERARIDSSGRLLVGTSASINIKRVDQNATTTAGFTQCGTQQSTDSRQFTQALISYYSGNAGTIGANYVFARSLNDTIGNHGIVTSGTLLGRTSFQGSDGVAFQTAASITSFVDAAPAYAATALVAGQIYRIVTVGTTNFTLIGSADNNVGTVFTATGPGTGTGTAILNAGNMPGRLVFSTTADGAATPTERMRITNAGNVGIGTGSPGALFHCETASSELIRANSTAAGGGYIAVQSSGTNIIYIGSGASLSAALSTDGTIRANNNLTFATGGGTERARIDSSGRLLVGTSTARTNFYNSTSIATPAIQVEGTNYSTSSNALICNSNNVNNFPVQIFAKSAGTAVGSNTIVTSTDIVGQLSFQGSDGAEFIDCAGITAYIDGTPGANDMPGRLVFSTTLDGAASPTEAFRITNDRVRCYNQAAPAAVDTTATLTVANLKTGIITSTTAAAVTMTLPTGTDTEAGFSGIYTNMTFEWSVINTGATNAVTVQGGTGHTLVGSGTVAASNSGRFASRRTAANTFVTYRLSS